MKNTNLKFGTFYQPMNGKEDTMQRYIVENLEDLEAFFTEFPDARQYFEVSFKKDLAIGRIILLTDPHPASGLNTYCFESEIEENQHPTSILRLSA